MTLRVLPAGDAAVLCELPAGDDVTDRVLALDAALRADPLAGVLDVVPAHDTVLVSFDPRTVRAAEVAGWLRAARPAPRSAEAAGTVTIQVTYDGEDLAEVGRLTGLGADGVVAAHSGQPWRVAFTGFAPGFGYLVPERRPLDVPRRDRPRERVPAGSVALAGGYTGVYPRASPGGWHLLGRTAARVWDPAADPPALLTPGTRVTFRAA